MDDNRDHWSVSDPEPLTEELVNGSMMVLERRIREELSHLEARVTELETRPDSSHDHQCRAVLRMSGGIMGSYRCILPEGHNGPHTDDDGDSWEIRTAD